MKGFIMSHSNENFFNENLTFEEISEDEFDENFDYFYLWGKRRVG